MTLRRVKEGWNAEGRLAPLWKQLDGPAKRDQLAELTGITPQTLSAYNSGSRPLGITNARRIVEALAARRIEVSLLELGAPVGEADERGLSLVDLLEELRATVALQQKTIDTQDRSIRTLQGRVRVLERGEGKTRRAGGGG